MNEVASQDPVPASAPPAKKRGGGLALGILAALLLLGGGGAAAWFLWLNAAGPELARYAPKDTQVYFEVPSVAKALVSFVGVDFIDEKELDSSAKQEEVIGAFAKSFGITEDEAEDVVTAVKSVGVAYRKDDDRSQGAAMIGLSSASAIEPLLASKRFKDKGDFAGGKRYVIARREVEGDRKDEKPIVRFFNDLGEPESKDEDAKKDDDDDEKGDACVWFKGAKLWTCGDAGFVKEIGKVVDGSKDSLAKGNESFAKAKWPGGSTMVAFVDPKTFEDDVQKELFKESGPLLLSSRFVDAGIMLTASAELTGKKVPAEDVFDEPGELKLYRKLPATTVAYLAMSTKTSLDGKEFRKKLVKAFDAVDEKDAARFDKDLDGMKDALDFDLEMIVDAVGDEMIVAVNATDKLTAEMAMKKDPEALDEVGFECIIHLRDKEKAEKILKAVKGKVEDVAKDGVDVSKKEGGFLFEPKKAGLPGVLAVIKDDKYLFIAGGTKKRITEMEAAFDGDSTLGGDGGHTKSIGSFSVKPRMLLWADAGRVAKAVLKEDGIKEVVKETLKESGLPLSAFVLEGDDRLTFAASLGWAVKDGAWTVTTEALNGALPAPVAIYGVRRYLQSAKSSEAKNTIGAIARGAVGAYERERVEGKHALCGAAVPVPAVVPSGTKHQPSSEDGKDFETGNSDAGWKCLKFSMTQPHYYQYDYRVGGNYKGPARGGPDPGANGFEASAEGDLDGDGQTSLFTVTGTVSEFDTVKISTEVFTSDEFE